MHARHDSLLITQALTLCSRGETTAAGRLFLDHMGPPLTPQEALYGACILASQREEPEALRLIRQVSRKSRDFTSADTMTLFACYIMEDVLAVSNEKRAFGQLRFRKRNRLLKAVHLLMIAPALAALRVAAGMFASWGFPDGATLQRLAGHLACQCWVNGLPARPPFVKKPAGTCPSQTLEAAARQTYEACILKYLRHWLPSGQDPAAVLLAIVKPGDAHALYCLVRQHSPKVILEIGTFTGFSTSILAQAARDNGQGAAIHCIDPNLTHLGIECPLEHARQLLRQQQLDEFVTIHEGFFSEPREAPSPQPATLGYRAADLLPPVDFAFIDGSHATMDVLFDVRLLLPALADHATIVFHDVTTWHSVRQAIQLIMNDDVWQHCLEYHDVAPGGFDGLGIMYFKRPVGGRAVEKAAAPQAPRVEKHLHEA